VARARLRRGIELVKLANRIEALKIREGEGHDANDADADHAYEDDEEDMPGDAAEAAGEALAARNFNKGLGAAKEPLAGSGKKSLSKIARGAIFREVVLAKVRELKEEAARKKFEEEAASKASP
jgi:calcium/calmodulin-dependent protein kinase I